MLRSYISMIWDLTEFRREVLHDFQIFGLGWRMTGISLNKMRNMQMRGKFEWENVLKGDFSFCLSEFEDQVGYLRGESLQVLKLLKLQRDQAWAYRVECHQPKGSRSWVDKMSRGGPRQQGEQRADDGFLGEHLRAEAGGDWYDQRIKGRSWREFCQRKEGRSSHQCLVQKGPVRWRLLDVATWEHWRFINAALVWIRTSCRPWRILGKWGSQGDLDSTLKKHV